MKDVKIGRSSRSGVRDLRMAFLLNLSFAFLEVFGGIWTNSVAIVSGAIHDLGDSVSLALAWYLARFAERGSDSRYSYGYRRFSLVGALATALVLVVGSLLVLSEAIPRLLQPEQAKAGGMAVLAIIGIAVNGVALARVQGGRALNERLVAWHLMGDLLGWGAVLCIGFILLFTNLPLLDPILSILITSYVLFHVSGNLKKTVQLFLQAVPRDIDLDAIEKKLLAIAKVESVHHTHVWSLDGERNVLTTHLVVEADTTKEELLGIRKKIATVLGEMDLEHTTVEIGYASEHCRMKDTEERRPRT